MHIIFGKDKLDGIDSKYTVLELDTFRVSDQTDPVTAYCVVETIPIMEMAAVDQFRDLHANLIKNYREKNWKYCEDALEHLIGKWNREIDSFYQDIFRRVQEHKANGVPQEWDGFICRPAA